MLPSVKWECRPVPHGLCVGIETTRVKSTKHVEQSQALLQFPQNPEVFGGRG